MRALSLEFWRRLAAVVSTVVLHLGAFGWRSRSVCAPGLACHGCPWVSTACPVGVAANASAVHAVPALALGTTLSVGAATGRLACGWLCPFGLFQELLGWRAKKLTLPAWTRFLPLASLLLLVFACPFFLGFEPAGALKLTPPESLVGDQREAMVKVENLGNAAITGLSLHAAWRSTDPGAGAAAVFWQDDFTFPEATLNPGESLTLPPFSVPKPPAGHLLEITSPESVPALTPVLRLHFCSLCPAGTLTSALPAQGKAESRGQAATLYAGSYVRYGILALLILLMFVLRRAFCQLLCPLGALWGLFSAVALIKVARRKSCTACGDCRKVCPVNHFPGREAGTSLCIACGQCIGACPEKAIGWKTPLR